MTGLALVLAGFACFAVHFWCESQCTRLDVETGRRDAGALIDDYGSNRGWYPRWKIPSILSMFAGIALWLHAVGACTMLVQAHDHSRPGLDGWYQGLTSGKGLCCDGSDATHLADVDWESRDGRYRVRIEGEWHDVPPEAVLDGPNLDGRTLVWPIKGYGGLTIRCFMPGAMT